MKHCKILLAFSDTGAGHRSAADAIKKAICEISPQKQDGARIDLEMRDVVDASNALNRLFAHMYNDLLKNHQDWMKYYIALIEWIKPNESEICYRLACEYTKNLVREIEPDIIVSVHPMVNHFLARTLQDLGLKGKVKFVIVLTDPNANLWTGWACPDADLIVAPNDLAFDKLISMGIDPALIKVIGMPVKPDFLRPPHESRQSLLSRLGLNPDKPTVTITAGSAGGGNMEQIYRALERLNNPLQVIFICGDNEKLRARMEIEAAKSPVQTIVLSRTDSLSDAMAASDLLVTKAGGLTTFEAIARRLPMALDLITEPMPQEAGTVDMLVDAGLAQVVRHPDDIIPIVEKLRKADPERQFAPLPQAHNLAHVDAVYEIAKTILALGESSPA